MNDLTIVLKKRKNKLVLYLIALFLMTITLFSVISSLLDEFNWFLTIFFAPVFLMSLVGYKRVVEYFTFGEVKLVVQSDGKTINFYNVNAKGKSFNKSETFDLEKMKRFYIVKKRTRYFMNNYAFAFEAKPTMSNMLGNNVNAFPSLFEATPTDRESILHFVKEVNSDIELGFENVFQKIQKKLS